MNIPIVFENIYNKLIENPFNAIWCNSKESKYIELNSLSTNCNINLHVYPGSFNPLHETHKYIFKSIPGSIEFNYDNVTNIIKTYEISIQRFEKPNLSVKDLYKRCIQFDENNFPLLITFAPLFFHKIGLFKYLNIYPTFYIGYDTFYKIIKYYDKLGALSLDANFVVYDRIINNKTFSLNDEYKMLYNFKRGEEISTDLMSISSSEIRKKSKNT